jgi:hypothetical protein
MVRELDLAVKVLKSCGLAKAEELGGFGGWN